MNSSQQKKYDAALDKMDLTDSQRDAFDHSVKKGLVDLDTYQDTDCFSLHGYKLSQVMDDIVLAQYVDLDESGNAVKRGSVYIPLAHVKRTWRMARVILAGPKCQFAKPGDIVCFPDDKGIKVDNLSKMLCNIESIKLVKESHVLSLLRYMDLVNELKQVHS